MVNQRRVRKKLLGAALTYAQMAHTGFTGCLYNDHSSPSIEKQMQQNSLSIGLVKLMLDFSYFLKALTLTQYRSYKRKPETGSVLKMPK